MNNTHPEYSKEKIIKNVKYTALGAIIILVTIVLPAEYGIDATGFGRLTGLIKLAPNYQAKSVESIEIITDEKQSEAIQGESISENYQESYEYQELEKTYTLRAGKDTEIKFNMYKGSKMTFDWESSEIVYFDQHGEPTTSKGKEFLPYKTVKEGKQMSGSGVLTAEFTGTHGWYWRNLSNDDITIKLTLKGKFQ